MKNNEERDRKPLLTKERLGAVALVLLLAEVLLVILSWLLSATRMEGVRSLLSSEGIRWFFGSWQSLFASPLLVWLLLCLIAWGCLRKSGLNRFFTLHSSLLSYRDRLALRVSLVFLVIYLVILALLTLTPHAILLSATGHLFPSAFSRSLVPVIAFGVCLVSVTFGLVSGRLRSLGDILDALSTGIARGASLIVVYLFAIQLFESFRFVFG
jgi:aminobenzoyl-glutamate transport protein